MLEELPALPHCIFPVGSEQVYVISPFEFIGMIISGAR